MSEMVKRKKLILQAIDTFIKVHDDWEVDMKAPPQPHERFEKALKLAVEVCEKGDTPQDCRRLVSAMAKLGLEWLRYENGHFVSDAAGDVRPAKSFWDAVRQLKIERKGSAPFQPKKRESIALLMDIQKVSPEQIARFIYADPEWENGYGPFLDHRGAVDYEALERERKEPGSVLGKDYVHYDDRKRLADDEETLRTRLAALAEEGELLAGNTSTEDPEQMLRDGAYLNQVATCCNMTMEEVIALAEKLGIHAESTPNLAAQRAPQEPEINPHAAAAMDARVRDVPYEEPTVETPEQQVARLATQGRSAEEIAEQLGLTLKQVGRMMQGVGA